MKRNVTERHRMWISTKRMLWFHGYFHLYSNPRVGTFSALFFLLVDYYFVSCTNTIFNVFFFCWVFGLVWFVSAVIVILVSYFKAMSKDLADNFSHFMFIWFLARTGIISLLLVFRNYMLLVSWPTTFTCRHLNGTHKINTHMCIYLYIYTFLYRRFLSVLYFAVSCMYVLVSDCETF